MKRVEVVLLNWNGWRDTLACVASLRSLEYPAVGIIVVDNGSTDGSEAQLRSHLPDVTVLQTGANLGFGGGCNYGIQVALQRGADYVWLVNSDATVAPSALSAAVKTAECDLCIGAVGSVIFETVQRDQVQVWGGGRVNLWLGRSQHQRSAPNRVDFLSGAALLLRRDALQQTGGFDDKTFFMYWEDTDLGFRLRQAGWQLAVAAESRVWHKQSASLGRGSALLDRYFVCSGARFMRRHAPMPWLAIGLMGGAMLAKRLLSVQFTRAGAVLRGLADA